MIRTLAILLLFLWPTAELYSQPQQHRIEGVVVDDQGKPIPAVTVTAYRGNSNVVDTVKTDGNGKYSLKYPEGTTITNVVYDHSAWTLAKIGELSGKLDHNINKVLLPRGSQLSRGEAVDALAAYHAIFLFKGAESNPAALGDLRSKYSDSIKALKIPEDSDLYQSKDRIMTLYGIKQ